MRKVLSMSKPVRLDKNNTDHNFSFNKVSQKVEEWAFRYAHILLPLFIILGLILFVLLCYAICGVSATESGVQYNQFDNII